MSLKPQDFFRPEILKATAYSVAAAEGRIKLDAMENPYPWPESLVEGWLNYLSQARPNRYPDPEASALKAALRRYANLPEDAEVLLGNGSDEIIQIVLLALAGHPGATVLAPEPSFVMYRQVAQWLGVNFVGVPLNRDFSLDLDAMLANIARHRPKIVFLAYPNNPTGNLFDASAVLTLIERTPGLVIVDEAYAPFAQVSFTDRLGQFPNLLVMQTLSKLGLAGLRLGFLAGPREWLEQFNKLRLPYNINVLTQLSAEFALTHLEVFQQQTARIRAERAALFTELASLPQVQAFPSAANFILFRVKEADRVFNGLKSQGVLIKNLNPQGGLLQGCLRVTVGTPAENQAFLRALRAALGFAG
nr:histidinol-phosphate aminotransferase [uncultured Gammaproteobacteria bacterium]BAL56670.1 histidinol-phosphate aminotransferase [uncultured Gammaproteobacteria bacterium]